VHGILVDAYWPEHNLIVEVDGWNFHKTKRSFENDRRRDVKLQIAGYRVARFTAARIMHHPDQVACDLRALLSVSEPPAPAAAASDR
jgi:very-short-patch-repair endonuclease